MILRWLRRLVVVLAAAFVLVYFGDWSFYRFRGSPTQTIDVHQFVTVPLKGRKTEYDYLGNSSLRCSVSLFPQDGRDPCWQLRRSSRQMPNP